VPPSQDLAAFAFRNAPISVAEVLRAAHFRNELRPCAVQLVWELACEKEAGRLALEADDDAVEALVNRFRYELDLISAEETEAWLDGRGLDGDDLQAYIDRSYWWGILKERVAAESGDILRGVPELLGILESELFLSGGFAPLAVGLSRRLVANQDPQSRPTSEQVARERGRFLARMGLEPDDVAGWLASLDRGPPWLEEMLELEAAYRLSCDAILTPERLSGELAVARLPLTRLELERVEFDSVDAAREAHLCVRHDGLSLEDVARETRYPYKRFELLAEDLPEAQRQKLLCAAIGEVQAPEDAGGVFQLVRVLRKAEPTLAEAAVRHRIEQRILDGHFSEAGSEDVSWLIR
jgi:hypothetical protein